MTNGASPQPNNKNKKSQITNPKPKSNKPPPSYPHPKYQHHTISAKNQYSQQTPRSIQQTYSRDAVLSNEKDAPKMTTAQCNRPRRWSCLQCVRDGQRTKDHENSARHATNKTKSTTILHASYAGSDGAWWRRCAAHDDDKVRIATNNQDITNLQNQCNQSPLPHNHIQLKTTTQNHKQKQPSQQTPCSITQTCR